MATPACLVVYAAKLSSYNSDSVARKAENIYYLALYNKGLLTPL